MQTIALGHCEMMGGGASNRIQNAKTPLYDQRAEVFIMGLCESKMQILS